MIQMDELSRLMECFPGSFIIHTNSGFEFIADKKSNTYFILTDCNSKLDIKCKVLEWLSRPAYKTEPFESHKKNKEFHTFMLNGINSYMETSFTPEDMEEIYTYLGNACNHEKTIEFIANNYSFTPIVNKVCSPEIER